MAPTKVNANGHRRRQVVARVKREETHCALCDQWVDPNLEHPHPKSGVVDEDIPRSRGGSQYQRSNCHLMHRDCNRWKFKMTLAEARAKLRNRTPARPTEPVEASPIW